MKILAFGIAKEILGSASVDVAQGENITVGDLKNLLGRQHPELKKLSSFMIAVNNEYAPADKIINTADEIAIIPPVSGG